MQWKEDLSLGEGCYKWSFCWGGDIKRDLRGDINKTKRAHTFNYSSQKKEAEADRLLWFEVKQVCLHSEFQAIQSYIGRPCLNSKTNKKKSNLTQTESNWNKHIFTRGNIINRMHSAYCAFKCNCLINRKCRRIIPKEISFIRLWAHLCSVLPLRFIEEVTTEHQTASLSEFPILLRNPLCIFSHEFPQRFIISKIIGMDGALILTY